MQDQELTEKVVGCAFQVHNVLGPGFLEKVYENALVVELEKTGLTVQVKRKYRQYRSPKMPITN